MGIALAEPSLRVGRCLAHPLFLKFRMTPDRTIRFGIVGAGMMAREHIRNLMLMRDATVTALADPVQSSLEKALRTLGEPARTFSDTRSLVASGLVDAVIVASPNHTHRAVLNELFGRPIHILCEKPLCTTVEDAEWAAERAGQHPNVFWVGMEYRFMPPAAQFIAGIRAGQIGRLHMLAIREHRFPFLTKVGDWNRFSRNTGGTMVEKCCHFFDLMRLIAGSEATRVFCSGAMDVNHRDERYDGQMPDIIDNSYTIVDFANGVRAMLDLCMFAEGAKNQEELSAVGDKARLEAFIPDGRLVFSPRVAMGQPKKIEERRIEVDERALKAGTHHGATYYQLQAFLDAVQGKSPVQVTALDGLRAVEIGAAAEQSARTGKSIDL
jgi:predicted dehydrogenase